MNCKKCGNEMLLLLTSYVCDYCDGRSQKPQVTDTGQVREGYIPWCPTLPEGTDFLVFRDKKGAEDWMFLQYLLS